MNMKHGKLGAAVLATALAAPAAHADLITDPSQIAGSIVVNFDTPAGSGLTSPVNVGAGTGYSVLFSAIGGSGSVGEAPLGTWVLDDNGTWGAGKTFAGVDGAFAQSADAASLVFDFGSLKVQKVGAFVNFDPGFTYGGGFPLPLYIAALDSSGAVLEYYDVPVFAPNGIDALNEGAFYGLGRGSADIAKLVIGGPYAVADDLSFTAPVPEPSTYALLLAGLGLLGFAARRARRS